VSFDVSLIRRMLKCVACYNAYALVLHVHESMSCGLSSGPSLPLLKERETKAAA